MADNRSWEEVAEAETKAVMDSLPIKDADTVRHLTNAIYASAKADNLAEKDQLARLAFLSGMACVCLLDYAKILDSRGHEKE